jgi:hypothetical protein
MSVKHSLSGLLAATALPAGALLLVAVPAASAGRDWRYDRA